MRDFATPHLQLIPPQRQARVIRAFGDPARRAEAPTAAPHPYAAALRGLQRPRPRPGRDEGGPARRSLLYSETLVFPEKRASLFSSWTWLDWWTLAVFLGGVFVGVIGTVILGGAG